MKKPLPIGSALISVYDKSGLDTLCKTLHEHKIQIYSTGGTAKKIESLRIPVTSIESLTQSPEFFEGRVKTLHPKVYGGILYRRGHDLDESQLKEFGIPSFDLVVVNYYPYKANQGLSEDKKIEYIDIGGPSSTRAAAKNYHYVTVLSDPSDYVPFMAELNQNNGRTSFDFRQRQAIKTFERTSSYDALITRTLKDNSKEPIHSVSNFSLSSLIPQTLRYGENPHQQATWFGQTTKDWTQHQGKELSYNNLIDAEAAARITADFTEPTVAIIKHTNPCGAASDAKSVAVAYQKALAADPKSAFGGIVSLNHEVDEPLARLMSEHFYEVIIAPSYTDEARETFVKKKNLRIIEYPNPVFSNFDLKPCLGGWVSQETPLLEHDLTQWEIVTKAQPDPSLMNNCLFAWKVITHIKSNAILLSQNRQTIGIGAGQMSRVDAVELALHKKTMDLTDQTVLTSDAFFPFRDSIDSLKNTPIKTIIQPGGSVRDPEVIEACDEHQIAMIFTHQRVFKH